MASKLTATITALTVALGASLGASTILSGPAQAAPPASATDASKVPHYFGPYPNWALSPLRTAKAKVVIADSTGVGKGAAATVNIDPITGGLLDFVVTQPGTGYTAGNTTVTVSGGTADAIGIPVINPASGVTSYAVTAGGGGYSGFNVVVDAPATGTTATASASGSVDAVTVDPPTLVTPALPALPYTTNEGYKVPIVEFDLPDLPNGVQALGHVDMADPTAFDPVAGTVFKVIVDTPGSGYSTPPGVAIHNGTTYDPISGAIFASAHATLALDAVTVTVVGDGYTAAPLVTVNDTATPVPPAVGGSGALATAVVSSGSITSIALDPNNPGAGFLSKGIKKFQDQLPLACDPATAGSCPAYDPALKVWEQPKFLPLTVPEQRQYTELDGTLSPMADQISIGLVQYRTKFNTDLPPTLARGYVQLETPGLSAVSQHVPLFNELLDGSKEPVLVNGAQAYGITSPQWLGPVIAATKDKPVRVIFRNLLPTGAKGDLFLPTDSSMMGSGMTPMPGMAPVNSSSVLDEVRNPTCTQEPKPVDCFKDNRATLHLHGGMTPWISDGTPHQWITPAGEATAWPQGVSVQNVPDMASEGCDGATDGCQTFYYTNQQSARLMFYHDHSWGITRLNVYAGEAAGYIITDDTEKALVASGTIPAAVDTIPLIVQDRTFVPDAASMAQADPTWDAARWGGEGNFWYHHVYMPAQNPGSATGMSAYGRWMYGPWFFPPATGTKYGPIDNPYFDSKCDINNPATWQYQVEPFCEPQQIPGTPNVSAGMEQFNDTPTVNGVAYPTITLDPKAYRLRFLNAANDRFFNFQWYIADNNPANNGANGTEVRLDPTALAAAQTDPNVVPTPAATMIDGTTSTFGPDWYQIGTEGGFLPAPAVISGHQPITWITDPTRFDVGNVDQHSLAVAPAERADTIVDFSKFAGQTLILYNDAPAAYPARVASYDYYTGQPDLSPVGAPGVLPGYGPNTRTIMQVKISANAPTAFDLAKLQKAFKHNSGNPVAQNTPGVFESGQNPIIVGQAAYNSTYGTNFTTSGNCSLGTLQRCDGLVRINDTTSFNFNTLNAPVTRSTIGLEPKAIHDEMNASTFDEFGRMQANLGMEHTAPANGVGANVTLYPYVNPQTELIDGTNLQSAGIKATAITTTKDGTQIWRITHNGVDTHPIHFHLYDVQLINRVTWDNIIIPNDANEMGWKDTVRVSPLEDTIVALRPQVPKVPFEIPNSVRALNPMMPLGDTSAFNNVDPQGNGTAAISNRLVNFGWEYVYHCHILSHEEMDMMRPVSLALPPIKPSGVAFTTDPLTKQNTVSWSDNSITETSFGVERTTDGGATWKEFATSPSPLDVPNVHEARSALDPVVPALGVAISYRVVAYNAVGYFGGGFPTMTVKSVSDPMVANLPAIPSALTATVTAQPGSPSAGPQVNLAWTDNADNETGFVVQRTADGGLTWKQLSPAPTTAAGIGTTVTFTDLSVVPGTTYAYQVAATNATGTSPWSTPLAGAVVPLVPNTPAGLAASVGAGPQVNLSWSASPLQSGYTNTYTVEKSTDGGTTWAAIGAPGTATTLVDAAVSPGAPYQYRVSATNVSGTSAPSNPPVAVDVVATPQITGFGAVVEAQPSPAIGPQVSLTWTLPAKVGTPTVVLERRISGGGAFTTLSATAASPYVDLTVAPGTSYDYRLTVTNVAGTASAAVTVDVPATPSAPTGVVGAPSLNLNTLTPQVTVNWTAGAGGGAVVTFRVDRCSGTCPAWTTIGTVSAGTTQLVDATVPRLTVATTYFYRVTAINVSGRATSAPSSGVVVPRAPTAPNQVTRTLVAGPSVRVTWADRANNETGFVIQRADSTTPGVWANVGQAPARGGTGSVSTFTDTTIPAGGGSFIYRVAAINNGGASFSAATTALVIAPLPAAPTIAFASATASSPTRERLTVNWAPGVTGITGYTVRWSTSLTMAPVSGQANLGPATTGWTSGQATKRVWFVQVGATNASGTTWSAVSSVAAAP